MNSIFASPAAGLFGRRQKRARGTRVPVSVLTGFLGAGKTTLLKRFLATPEGQGTAVVINEFGATGIDDALVRDSADETVLLGNGCLCCIARTDLQETLRRLVFDRDRGTIPPFRRVVIETSGMADPSPILQTFATDRALGDTFHLDVVMAVVDAENGLATLERASEARKQVILADRIVVSKTDIADARTVQALTARLAALNPDAEIEQANHGAIDPARLIEPTDGPRNAFVAEAEHSDGIGSFVLTLDGPLPWQAFARTMDVLTTMRGTDLLRVKGFLDVRGCAGPVIVQFVQHLSHPPVELERWPEGEHRSRLVFITRGISERQVRDLLESILSLIADEAKTD